MMRALHARPALAAGKRIVGRRIVGTLGAVALAATLLSGCGDDQDAPDQAGSTASSSTTQDGAPSGTPDPSGTATTDPEASGSPSDDASDDGASDGSGEDPRDGAGDSSDEPSAEASTGGDQDEDAGSADDEDAAQDGDGTDDASEDEDGKGSKADEPKEPDHIEYGEVSARVGTLQQRLKDLGYFVTSVDKAYGGETQQAVFALQKAGGLYRDGVVGDETRSAADEGVVPKAHSSSGKVLEIDVDRQLVLAVEDGKVVKVINASSGNGSTYEAKGSTYTAYTPRGSFAVYREENRMYSSSLELGDMWRPKFFTGGIAVHGSSSVPAFPASHGCVRVSNSAMDWIWDSWGAPSGTSVVVY